MTRWNISLALQTPPANWCFVNFCWLNLIRRRHNINESIFGGIGREKDGRQRNQSLWLFAFFNTVMIRMKWLIQPYQWYWRVTTRKRGTEHLKRSQQYCRSYVTRAQTVSFKSGIQRSDSSTRSAWMTAMMPGMTIIIGHHLLKVCTRRIRYCRTVSLTIQTVKASERRSAVLLTETAPSLGTHVSGAPNTDCKWRLKVSFTCFQLLEY